MKLIPVVLFIALSLFSFNSVNAASLQFSEFQITDSDDRRPRVNTRRS